MKYGSPNSKYCYPETDILINRLGLKDEQLLKEAEELYTAQRLIELEVEPLRGGLNLKHLQEIHKYIFQDLYDFSGQIREEDISKETTLFAKFQYIVQNAERLFEELKAENYLKGLNVKNFSKRAAYYMAELNVLHPFREGNGRAIREYMRVLAAQCGYLLHWDAVSKEELLEASIKSVNVLEPLALCIEKCISSV